MSRSVFVSGGNRGIGLATARALAADGHRVAVTYRGEAPPKGLFGVRCDVTDAEAVATAFDKVRAEQGPVEIMVASAGITRDTLLLKMSDRDFTDVVDTNLTGVHRVLQHAAQDMLAARWGRMIIVSSVVGTQGSPGQANYAASKSAHIGLARSLAWELGSRNITVNVVSPGLIETDMLAQVTDARRQEYLRMTPLRRTGTPEEAAAVVRFLAGEEAGFVTGAVVPVSGGLGLGL
ncbi:SDR family oxidoreductase [Streptomyces cellulosae]|uniref:SDR family oxidoreductase n=1 Tax=Streptomyces cellulosae TaxID=1968 RepID=UPI0004C60FF9|nr:SDR family oxidoreductase [Streptomyces cellulosae]